MTGWLLASALGPFAGYLVGKALADWQARREMRKWWRPTAPMSAKPPTTTELPNLEWWS